MKSLQLEELPLEILTQIVRHVIQPSGNDRYSMRRAERKEDDYLPFFASTSPSQRDYNDVYNLLKTSKRLFSAAVSILWRFPRFNPLASPSSWQRFLDAIVFSRNDAHQQTPKTMHSYSNDVVGIDDVWLYVGGEDFVEESHQVVREDSKVELLDNTLPANEVSISGNTNLHLTKNAPRRHHFFLEGTDHLILSQPINSLHYGLAILFTHCPNIQFVRLQLPLPFDLQTFPIHLKYLHNLKVLDIAFKVSDDHFRAIIFGDETTSTQAYKSLKSICFHRPEITDRSLKLMADHLPNLENLVLSSVAPTPTHSTHSTRRLSISFVPRTPPSTTHNGISSLLAHSSNSRSPTVSARFKRLDISSSIPEAEENELRLFESLACHSMTLTSLTLCLFQSSGMTMENIGLLLLPRLECLKSLTLVIDERLFLKRRSLF
jgi:hypothetical protein